jgi:hypothetical protein
MTSYDKKHPIGRVRLPDPRDRQYEFFATEQRAMRLRSLRVSGTATVAERALDRGARAHKRGPTLDQGPTSRCTLFTMAQLVLSGPVMQNITQGKQLAGLLNAARVHSVALGLEPLLLGGSLDGILTAGYQWAQDNDEYEGTDYEGTSGRAAAQFFRALGYWNSFWWTTSVEEDVDYLLRFGPLGFGSDWFTGMDKPDSKGYLRPEGTWRGGHEYTIDRVQLDKPGWPDLDGDVWIHQSWGKKTNGAPYEVAKMRLADLRYLRSLGADSIAVATEQRIV